MEAIKAGKIRGAVGIVGCNNPKIKHDYGHVTLTKKRLIENDILVVDTGCVSVANAKAGSRCPRPPNGRSGAEGDLRRPGHPAGPAPGQLCGQRAHPGPGLAALANALGVDISDLPVAGSAPEWYSEKAVTIGTYYCVASGITTHLGPMPPITGSMNVVGLLTDGLKDVVGATFAVEPDPEKAAVFLRKTIEGKRKALGLDARDVE